MPYPFQTDLSDKSRVQQAILLLKQSESKRLLAKTVAGRSGVTEVGNARGPRSKLWGDEAVSVTADNAAAPMASADGPFWVRISMQRVEEVPN